MSNEKQEATPAAGNDNEELVELRRALAEALDERSLLHDELMRVESASVDLVAAFRTELDTVATARDTALAEAAREKEDKLRALADAQNVRRTTATEIESVKKFGAMKMVGDILGVLDNFDRAVANVPESLKTNADAQNFVQGIEMIQGMLTAAFARHGVKEIEAKGVKFNPNLHQAVMQVDATDEAPSGHVNQVAQKGYTLNERVVRPAVVTVSK